MLQANFGCRPSKIETTDLRYGHLYQAEALDLPKSFLLPEASDNSDILDQGNWPFCPGFGGAGLINRDEGRGITPFSGASPLFIYANAKKLDGEPDVPGTQPKIVMQVLQNMGACLANTFPMSLMVPGADPTKLPVIPATAIAEAKKYVILNYAQALSVDDIKAAIWLKRAPVVIGHWVFQGWQDGDVGPDGCITVPKAGERSLGLHCTIYSGWDDELSHSWPDGRRATGFLRLINSWGTSWAQKGRAWASYEFNNAKTSEGIPYLMEAWGSTAKVLLPQGANHLIVWIGKKTAIVDGQEVQLDEAAEIDPEVGRTLVPIRFIAENLDYDVSFDAHEKRIDLVKRQ